MKAFSSSEWRPQILLLNSPRPHTICFHNLGFGFWEQTGWLEMLIIQGLTLSSNVYLPKTHLKLRVMPSSSFKTLSPCRNSAGLKMQSPGGWFPSTSVPMMLWQLTYFLYIHFPMNDRILNCSFRTTSAMYLDLSESNHPCSNVRRSYSK
jgi:hypothetical protein